MWYFFIEYFKLHSQMPFPCSGGAADHLSDWGRAMGNVPEVSLHRSHPRGWHLLLRHRHGVLSPGRLPQARRLQLQTPDPLQRHAGRPQPDVALLPGPRVEARRSGGGVAVWRGEPDPAAGAGAPEWGPVPADFQRTRPSRVPIHCHWYCEKRYHILLFWGPRKTV